MGTIMAGTRATSIRRLKHLRLITIPFLLALVTVSGHAQVIQEAYVKASNSGEGGRFGEAVALEGDTLVVGSFGERSNGTGVEGDQTDASLYFAGAVYVFTRSGESWVQQAYIKASNTESDDQFGASVDISGDTLVVGAPAEDSSSAGVNGDQANNMAMDSGAVYVFVREGNTWRQQAYLKASNPENPDRFGDSVAIHGDTIVVGASQEASNAQGVDGDQHDNSTRNAGAAYVFTRQGEVWTQAAYLKASNTDSMNFDYAQDFFGYAVDIYQETIVVGAYGEDSSATGINGDQNDESAPFSGAVYVFVKNAQGWKQHAYLKASNTGSEDGFGRSVSVYKNRLVVGAYGEKSSASGVNVDQTDDSFTQAGAAYVFVRNGDSWVQEAYLKASNPRSWDYYGESVATFGEAVLVGAWDEDSSATGINGLQDDDSYDGAGSAYLYRKSEGVWRQDAYIKASNTGLNDLFGQSVAIDGNTLAVGAQLERSDADGVNGDQTDDSARDAGAVYVFTDPTLNLPKIINPGINDAWYNKNTAGQGFLISVFPNIQQMFVAWFTYDVERPSEEAEAILGEPGHRWLTAQGAYTGGTASLTIYVTEGGVFDANDPPAENDGVGDGTMTIEFADCTEGLVTYEINSLNLSGEIPIQRIVPDNVELCEALTNQ
jgi:hypothetical protein